MAKKAKKTGFSIQGFDAGHYRQTEEYLRAIDAIYQQAVNDFALLGDRLSINPEKPFSLTDYPSANAKAQQVVNNLASRMQAVVVQGIEREWLYACKKNDEFLNHILNTSRLSKKTLQKFQDRNLSALSSFQKRKVDGLDLSKRIWRYADQFKTQMELGLDIGIGEGKSAQVLSKELRSFLVDPDKLFRRVRDKHGNLVLSKNAKAFNPGQGKYRSSYKNAMRLTRSEINMAYREADHLRWQKLDFVVGFEVKVSNKHEAFLVEWEKSNPGKVEICDQLKGRYPKTFIFKGWHPQCMCYAVPILMNPDEYNTDELNELRAALRGEEYKKFQSRNTVTDVPDGFKDWVQTNTERAQGWKSQPYFVRDNFKGANLENGLKHNLESITLSIVKPIITKSIPEAVKAMAEYNPSPSQRVILEEYTGGGYNKMNGDLRFKKHITEESQRRIDELDRFLQQAPKVETTSYRGMTLDETLWQRYSQLKKGSIFSDKGFMSTSYDKVEAMKFKTAAQYQMEITVKGKNGVLVEKLSLKPNEKEILFNRGEEFIIESIKVQKKGVTGKIVMTLKQL